MRGPNLGRRGRGLFYKRRGFINHTLKLIINSSIIHCRGPSRRGVGAQVAWGGVGGSKEMGIGIGPGGGFLSLKSGKRSFNYLNSFV